MSRRRQAEGQLDLFAEVKPVSQQRPCPCSDNEGGCGLLDFGPHTYAGLSAEYLLGMVAVFEGCPVEEVTVEMRPVTRDGRHYLYQVQRRSGLSEVAA